MIKEIKKNEIFDRVCNGQDVFAVDLNAVSIVWVNDMTIEQIMQYAKEGATFIINENNPVVRFDGKTIRKVDAKKFMQMLHDLNMSQNDLRNLAGISSTTIVSLKQGSTPQKKTLDKICAVLHCDPEDILV